jgi:hypothetical protein
MRTPHPREVVAEFNKLDLHDDGLASINVHPPPNRSNSAVVELQFRDDETGAVKILSFRDCANASYVMDFDVLASNWFAQTERARALNETERMQRFVRGQLGHWHVKYMPPSPKDKPIRKKLLAIKRYALFRITFFGGTFEILAKSFTFRQINKR